MANDPQNFDDRRLWISNLDTRMTEYQLLKILQKCGNIEKFDMLFHKTGPQAGQPRGFAFVTYKTVDESLVALDKLHGRLIGNKHIIVRFAKNLSYDELDKPKPKIEIPVLAAGSKKYKMQKEMAIQAIEAKLKSLETRKDDDLEINKTHSNEVPLIQKYQFNKNNESGTSTSSKSQINSRHHHYTKTRHTSSDPYNKKSSQKHHRR